MKTSFKNSFVYCIYKLDIMKKLLLLLLLVPAIATGQSRYVDVEVWQNGTYVGTVEMQAEFKDDYANGYEVAMDRYIQYLEEKETKERAERQRNALNERLKKLGIGPVPSYMGSAALEGYALARESAIASEKYAAEKVKIMNSAIKSNIMNAYDYASNITLKYKKELGIKKGSGYYIIPDMLFESQGNGTEGKYVRQEGNIQMIYEFIWPGERNIDFADRYKQYERFSNAKMQNGESWGNIVISRERIYGNTGIAATIEWEDEYDRGVGAYYGAEDSNGIDYTVYIESRGNKNEVSKEQIKRVFDYYKPLLEKCIANSRVTVKKLMNETVILDTKKTKNKPKKNTSAKSSSQNKSIVTNSKTSYLMLSLSYMKQKDYVNALKNIDKDIISNPENYESYRIKAMITGYIEGYEEFDKSYQIYLQKLKDFDDSRIKFNAESIDYVNFILSLFYNKYYIDSEYLSNIKIDKFVKTAYSEDFKIKQLNQAEEILNEFVKDPRIKKIVDEYTPGNQISPPDAKLLGNVFDRLYTISELKNTDLNLRLIIAEKKLLFAGLANDIYVTIPKAMGLSDDDVLSLKTISSNNKIWAHDSVGSLKIKLGKFKEAIYNFNMLVKLLKERNSHFLKLEYAFNQLAACKRESGDPKGAIQEYNNALKVNPNYTSSIGGRGTSKQYLNNLFGACDDWTRAVELGGESYQSKIDEFCNLNSSINAENLKEKATEELKKLKELFDLGLLTQEEFDKKAAELKKVILGN